MNVDKVALAEMNVDEVLLGAQEIDNIEDLNELETAERDGQNRVGVIDGIEKIRRDLTDDEVPVEEDVVYDKAPVDEVMPVIRSGDWGRISNSATKVPARARGRDVSVVSAVIRRGGPDTISTTGYEYQLPTDEITVIMRDGGEQFTCTRSALVAFAPNRGDLSGLLV